VSGGLDVLEHAVRGVPMGCAFALLAVGLVLAHRTSGVFNLAFAAQAYVSAAVFYVVRKDQGWPLVPAAVLAIGVVAPALGLLLERALFRHLRRAPALARTVTALGLLVTIPELVQLALGDGLRTNPPPLWPVERTDEWLWPEGSRFVLDAGQVVTVGATAVVAAALWVLLRWTALGLRMRAVVESARMAELAGVDADRVSMAAWALSSTLAGLAGVLLAPLFAALLPLDFFTLLVAALAACVVGRLASVPLAFAGGIGLGALQAVLAGWLPTGSVLATGLRPALPFVVLFLLLVVRPPRGGDLGGDTGRDDPLGGVDPPRAAAGARDGLAGDGSRPRALAGLVGCVACVAGLAVTAFALDAFWRQLVTTGLVLAIVFLSFTLVTGLGGMVSLCQATFAAIGAFTAARLVEATGMPVLVAVVAGALVAAAVGGALAVPVLRLDGIHLTLATLAFALMFENVLVPLDWVSGGSVPLDVPRPLVAGVDLADDRWFLVLVALVLAGVGVAVRRLAAGATGRFLDAVRTSEAAAVSVGLGPLRLRAVAFCLAAGIAGLGGGLMASWTGSAGYAGRYSFVAGLVWVVLVVALGARSVPAAVVAGLAFTLVPELLERAPLVPGDWARGLAFALFGLGALTYARHPEGVLAALPARRPWGAGGAPSPAPPGTSAERVARPPLLPRFREGGGEGGGPEVVLEARGVTKRFAGIVALDGVGLTVGAGECAGLVGPNGAGKTTLFDCLTGRLAPDAGEVRFRGRDLSRTTGVDRARAGLARTFQRVELFPGLTVAEHLLVAVQARLGPGERRPGGRRPGAWGDVSGRGRPTAEDLDRVASIAGLVGLAGDLDRPVTALPLGRARLVELGRALACEPALLLLDEPSSGLDRSEADAMAATIEGAREGSGVSVLLIEHDMRVVRRLATRLHVLDAGRLVAAGPTAAVLDDPAVRAAYLGTPPPPSRPTLRS
jgi:ABC-type branched-subunit amino acid transport system ATPase component/branched-subunit amino acid ABC-type transport system permease component